MTLYEVDLRVEYSRKVMVDCPDEDVAAEHAVEFNAGLPLEGPEWLPYRLDVQIWGIRVVEKQEMEDA